MTTRLLSPCLALDLITEIERAERSIFAANYLLIAPSAGCHIRYRELWQAMLAAPSRGIDCLFVVDNAGIMSREGQAAHKAATALAKAGWRVAMRRIGPHLHCKAWSFDAARSIIGSHNMSHQAMLGHSDLSLWSDDKSTAESLHGLIWALVENYKGPDYGEAFQPGLV